MYSKNKQTKATESYRQWKLTGDNAYRSEALSGLSPIVESALKSYGGGNPKLRTRAYIVAAKALDRYDPSHDVQLDTYVYNSLKALIRERQDRETAVHIPENVRMDSKAVLEFSDRFQDERGREPSLDEISEAVGLSHKRIARAKQVGSEAMSSMYEGEKGDVTYGEKRTRSDIWQDYIYHDLDPISQKIFEWKTGYGGSPIISSDKEIADKLGVSPAAVSQRKKRLVGRLQEGLL